MYLYIVYIVYEGRHFTDSVLVCIAVKCISLLDNGLYSEVGIEVVSAHRMMDRSSESGWPELLHLSPFSPFFFSKPPFKDVANKTRQTFGQNPQNFRTKSA